MYFSPPPITSSLLAPNIPLNTLFSNTLSLRSSLLVQCHDFYCGTIRLHDPLWRYVTGDKYHFPKHKRFKYRNCARGLNFDVVPFFVQWLCNKCQYLNLQ
jgi:hypothetical protein